MDFFKKAISKEPFAFIISLIACIYLTGWFIPLMEVDAAQYANISREMLHSGNYFQLYDRGADYLDKPPMLFWLGALSMYLFGVNDVAYRLPSFCFSLLSVYSCYRLCGIYYKKEIALFSAIVLASCQAMFLINHDVRTDTMLMGWVALSLWQLAEWYEQGKWKNFFIASIAIAGGMMTKGPIAVIVPVFAFAPHFILRRQWKQFFRWEYIVMVFIVLLLMIPMMVGLYQQFDMHPEKVMYGSKETSGLKFFFWTQSFGRITGESTWHEYSSFFFLFQNMLWSFLPWIIFFSIALIADIGQLFKKKFLLKQGEEWITTGGFILTYCALASSKAQLPHYIFIVFPLAAIVTGKFLYSLFVENRLPTLKKVLIAVHYVLFILLWMALLVLLFIPFQTINKVAVIGCFVVLILLYIMFSANFKKISPIIKNTLFTIAGINLCLNIFFYPALLQYQFGIPLSRYINKHNIAKEHFYLYQFSADRSFDFYADHTFQIVTSLNTLKESEYIITNKNVWDTLNKHDYKLVYEGEQFHVSMLTMKFLNPAKRFKETETYCVVQKL